jgi:tRNA nucleotidyltransferase/poly(A) polymerase
MVDTIFLCVIKEAYSARCNMFASIPDQSVKSAIQEVFATYQKSGYECFLVGGAVRDLLSNRAPKDFDFATNAPFDFTRQAFAKTIDTGISHGTISVIVNGHLFEITRFRSDFNHNGRHCEINFVNSVEEDLARRDFTLNAMAMTSNGDVIDPFGGAEDLRAGRVRFVGDADTRIQEDYLRILRWYRFTARFGQEYDVDALAAVERQCKGLKSISVERIWSEVKQIIAGPRGISTLYDMWYVVGVGHSAGFPRGAPWYGHPQDPPFSVTTNPVTLMVYMWRHEIYGVLKNWKASREEIDLAQYLLQPDRDCKAKNPFREMAVHGVSREWAIEMAALQNLSAMEIAMLDAWTVPEFPVTGYDLIKMGMKPGPQYGVVINKLKEIWADSGYTATKEQLLANVQV